MMAHDNPTFSTSAERLPAELNGEGILDCRGLNSCSPSDGPAAPRRAKHFDILEKMACFKMRCHWLVNGFIVMSLWSLITFLEFHIFTFWTIGFQCKDPNLSHKFHGDTIPFQYLLAITLAVPLVIILFVESILMNSMQSYLTSKKEKNLKQAWTWYGQYVFGFLILLVVVQVGKSFVGAPRPHFFDTCKPDKAVNCTSGHFSEYKCTNKNLTAWDLNDCIRSFPSGHAALGVYTAVFMSAFLQYRIPRNKYLVVPWLQCIFLTWAALCCLTRITDRRHHWWDVLAGSICGVVAGYFTVKTLCLNFHCKHRNPDKNLNDTVNINHAWNKKLLSSINNCNQKPSEEGELREVK